MSALKSHLPTLQSLAGLLFTIFTSPTGPVNTAVPWVWGGAPGHVEAVLARVEVCGLGFELHSSPVLDGAGADPLCSQSVDPLAPGTAADRRAGTVPLPLRGSFLPSEAAPPHSSSHLAEVCAVPTAAGAF